MFTNLFLFADSLGDGFRKFSQGSKNASDYWFVFTVIGLLVASAVGIYLWDRRREKTVRDESTPESLFRDLCNEHQLSPAERELLTKVIGADATRLEQPALVFVDPNILAAWTLRGTETAGVQSLSQKLFGR